MGGDRLRQGRARAGRLTAVAAVGLLLAGCASIPDSGDVEPVKASPHDDSQVRVYAVPPPDHAQPSDIVDGFLEAMTSDDPDFAMARKYLAKDEAKTWMPQKRTTVLRDAPERSEPEKPTAPDQPGLTYTLSGEEIAAVDASRVYSPVTPEKFRDTVHLIEEKVGDEKEWRIDGLPQGLVLGDSDFERNYRPIDTYFYASGSGWLVADPVYIRQRIDPLTRMDPVTQAVNVLLAGPTSWLKPVVQSSFPAGTRLQSGTRSLEFDDQNALTVPLNAQARGASHAQCRKMAAQLFFTLRDLTSTRVREIELRAGGSSLCTLAGDAAQDYAPADTAGHDPYFINAEGRLLQMDVGADGPGAKPAPVEGPFGDGTVKLDSVAVARDDRRAAAVTDEGKSLYVASIAEPGETGDPLVESEGKKPADRLSAPSWDSRGDVWIADRDPAHPRLLRFENGTRTSQEVAVSGLGGRRIEELRVSADGVRVALLLTRGSKTSLEIGRVQRSGSDADTKVSVMGLRPAAPQMESVTAVSWAGPSRLVVVGKETGGVQQVRYIQADGSTTDTSVLPGLNQVSAVAAGDDDSEPLIADAAGAGIVQLPTGGNWQALVAAGSSPVYPG